MYNKKSSSELKSIAKGTLTGHYALPMGAFVIVGLISGIIFLVLDFLFALKTFENVILYFVASIIVGLLIGVLSAGTQVISLKISRRIPVSLGDLFYAFSHQPDRLILLLLLFILIAVGCMVPGVALLGAGVWVNSFPLEILGILVCLAGWIMAFVLLLSYSQSVYIYIDDPDKGVMQVIKESKELMRGNKGRYFYLTLSFIGLELLAILSCYIGMLWIGPYMDTTRAVFYRNLKGEV